MKKFFTLALLSTAAIAYADNAKVAKANAPLLAPAASEAVAEDVVEVECELAVAQYYGAPDYDWYYCFNDVEGNYQFRFDVADQDPESIVLNYEFTEDDMVLDYSWGADYNAGLYIEYVSCTFYVTENAEGARNYYATILADSGITYKMTCLEYEDTVSIENVATSENAKVYTINGTAVKNASNGLYIINGRKALIK